MPPKKPREILFDLFRRHYGYTPPLEAVAPVPLELMGSFAEVGGGLTLGLALDRAVHLAFAPRTDGKVELVSTAHVEKQIFTLHQGGSAIASNWIQPIQAVIQQLQKRSAVVRGFSMACHTTIPEELNTQHAAALRVAAALALRRMFPYTLTATGISAPPKADRKGELSPLSASEMIHLAQLCQKAEGNVPGIHGGVSAHLFCLCARPFQAVEFDCQNITIEQAPLIGEISIVLCPMSSQPVSKDEPDKWKQLSLSAARKLGLKSLRSADVPYLKANRARLSEPEFTFARHMAAENQRIIFAMRALNGGDLLQVGELLNQSYNSLRELFDASETDGWIKLAREQPGCIAASIGGVQSPSAFALVMHNQAEKFIAQMASAFAATSGRTLQPIICRTAGGGK
ncbi:MAG TPA: hypothetical protein VGE41_02960 [Verrucomicrobiae bacterium]|jgi:galactokinase